MLTTIQNWLIRKLAGNRQVAVNLVIRDGAIECGDHGFYCHVSMSDVEQCYIFPSHLKGVKIVGAKLTATGDVA